jgi:hypothetical protein
VSTRSKLNALENIADSVHASQGEPSGITHQRREGGTLWWVASALQCFGFHLVLLLLLECACGAGTLKGCEPEDPLTLRQALDCTVLLVKKTDTRGACETFIAAHGRFVTTGRIGEFPLIDVERFFFEGGTSLLEYAGDAKNRNDRIDAAARAEIFFTNYIEWFSRLSEQQKDTLPDHGRVRSVIRFLGNALIAQDRKNDLHNRYLNTIGEVSLFGPDAITLWEQVLNELHGAPRKGSSSPDADLEWREFGDFVIQWANVPGLLPKFLRERYLHRGERILGTLS